MKIPNEDSRKLSCFTRGLCGREATFTDWFLGDATNVLPKSMNLL